MTNCNLHKPRIFWIVADRFDTRQDKSTWLEMTRQLSTRGWDIQILSGAERRKSEHRYGHWVTYLQPIEIPFLFRISILWKSYRWLRHNARKVDIIVLHEDALWLIPWLKAIGLSSFHLDIRTLPVRVKGIKRRIDYVLFWLIPLRFFGGLPTSYSFITKRLRESVQSTTGRMFSMSCVWQSGVNRDLFQPAKTAESNQNVFRLFYHGSLTIERGLEVVIRALAKRDLSFKLEFVMVGEGPHKAHLQKLVIRLGIDDLVSFKGFIPYEEIHHELKNADVCICPLLDRVEWNVSSPLKVLEYVASEKPMILTPIPAHMDLLGGQPSVVWTNGFRPEDINGAIKTAYERLSQISSAAPQTSSQILDEYTWAEQSKRLDKLLTTQYCNAADRA